MNTSQDDYAELKKKKTKQTHSRKCNIISQEKKRRSGIAWEGLGELDWKGPEGICR